MVSFVSLTLFSLIFFAPHCCLLSQEGDYVITFSGPVRMRRDNNAVAMASRTVQVSASTKVHIAPMDVQKLSETAKELV